MQTINTETLINFLLQTQTHEKSVNIFIAYENYLSYVKIHNREGTLKAYTDIMKPLLDYFNKHNINNTIQINDSVIDNYVLSRLHFVKNQTINKEILSLKIFLNYLVKRKIIDNINFNYEKLPVEKTIIESIEQADIKKILEYFENSKTESKYKLIFYLILTSGIRTNELLNIKNKNINLKDNTILLDFTKTHHSRYLYLIPKVKELLILVMNNNEYLFNDSKNNQLSANALRLFFKHLKSTLDIDVLSPHKLRHFYATNMYNKSKDIYLVSNLLGHTNIKTTEIYLDIDSKKNQKANEIFNPLNDFNL